MTTRRTYTCNLCGSSVADDPQDKITKPGVGIHHHSNSEMSTKRCIEVESHLCLDCIKAVWQLSQYMRIDS